MTERFSDDALLLRTSQLNEKDILADIVTRSHGRMRSVAKYGATSRHRAMYQQGNLLHIHWEARTPSQMGQISAEIQHPYFASLSPQVWRWQPVCNAAALLLVALYEYEPAEQVFLLTLSLYDALEHAASPLHALTYYALFEQYLLAATGFALDLARCAATGSTEELCYISPKTGRAVSREAGLPYHDRLFALPPFLLNHELTPLPAEVLDALAMNEYFLKRRLCDERTPELPPIRQRLTSLASQWLEHST